MIPAFQQPAAALVVAVDEHRVRLAMAILWAAGMAAMTPPAVAFAWIVLALAGVYTRSLFDKPMTGDARRLLRGPLLYATVARSLLWSAAPLLILHADRPGAEGAAALYLAAGFTLYGIQYRSDTRALLLVSLPLALASLAAVATTFAQSGAAVGMAFALVVFLAALMVQLQLANRVEASLEASNAQNRRLIAQLRLAVDSIRAASWHMDFATQTLTGAEDMRRVYGRTMTWADVLIPGTTWCHPDDRPVLIEAIAGMTRAQPRASADHRVFHPNGGVVWLRTTAIASFNARGGMTAMSGLTFDVSTEKRLELEVLNATREAETALAGQRRLFGDDAGPAADAGADIVARTLETSVHHLRTIVTEIAVRDETLAQMFADLARARAAAEQASSAKSQFLASMSHELRTPLNAIIGYGELLQESARERGDDEAVADLARVLAAAQRLLHLINDVLDLSRIEAGRMEASATPFAVAAMIEDAVTTVGPAALAHGNRLVIDAAPDLGEAVTDRFRLGQGLLNLLANAAKFTRDGKITVTARRETRRGGDWIVIAVADTGVGIAPEALAQLFQPFTQADATVASAHGGTGLGLAITRRLARLLGGDVTAASVQGAGATFTLAVPARLPQDIAEAA